MLMLLVPFQQGYAGASGGCDSAQAEPQQRPQRVPSPAPLPWPGMLCPGQALRGWQQPWPGSKDWERKGHGKENLKASKSGVSPMGTGFV